MKTAEQYIADEYGTEHLSMLIGIKDYLSIIDLTQEYAIYLAKQVAEQALKDAAENAELEEIPSRYPYGISNWKVDKESITSTPIITL